MIVLCPDDGVKEAQRCWSNGLFRRVAYTQVEFLERKWAVRTLAARWR